MMLNVLPRFFDSQCIMRKHGEAESSHAGPQPLNGRSFKELKRHKNQCGTLLLVIDRHDLWRPVQLICPWIDHALIPCTSTDPFRDGQVSNQTSHSNLASKVFKSFSQISNPYFTLLRSQIFRFKSRIKYRIFYANKCVNRFSIEIWHYDFSTLYFRRNHPRYNSWCHSTCICSYYVS